MPTDEQIIRRLAEMRGWDWRAEDYCVRFTRPDGAIDVSSPWNPLASYDTTHECMLAMPVDFHADFIGHLQCICFPGKLLEKENADLRSQLAAALEDKRRLETQLNTPELYDFSAGVVSEAQHQRVRWGSDHDAGKEPQDWFWLLGYLAGKALKAHASGDVDKALHHTVSSAAALANWHAAILGQTNMRPGIDPIERGIDAAMKEQG